MPDGRCGLRSIDSIPQVGDAASESAGVDADVGASRRFIAVHFPRWPLDVTRVALWRNILRLRRASAVDTPVDTTDSVEASEYRGERSGVHRRILGELMALPTVVVEGVQKVRSDRVARIIECCPLAAELGLSIGMTVAQAEAICSRESATVGCSTARLARLIHCRRAELGGGVADELLGRFVVDSTCAALVLRADEHTWGAMLRRLAACLERWVPRIAIDGLGASDPQALSGEGSAVSRYTLLGDLAGCAVLFRVAHGTEQVLMRRIVDSFAGRGFDTQLATASTIGTAIAVSRYGRCARAGREARCRAVPQGREADAIDPLPVEALRLPSATVHALHAVEVRYIGQLAQLKRGGVAARLSGQVKDVLDGVSGSASDGFFDGPRGHGAATKRKRGRKASRTEVASLFDLPTEGGEQPCSRDPVQNRCSLIGALVGGRDSGDPLLRLDQALGREPEVLVPLRMQEPVEFTKAFDGPTSRIDALFVACGELVDQLATALESKREEMRVSRWIFRHAELPSDLSTDFTALRIHVPDRHPPSTRRSAVPEMVSELELRLSAPTASRAHLWAILRPKLERLPLDHGVEEIIVRIEDAARMRSIQRCLPLRQGARRPQELQSPLRRPACAQPGMPRSDPNERHPPAAWSGIDDACAGWIKVSRSTSRLGVANAHPGDSLRLQEWIDLVAARIGRDRVHRVQAIGRGSGKVRAIRIDPAISSKQ